MLPSQSLTVISYCTHIVYRCLIIHRCRYPALDVLTAVSTNPSLPAIQWK